MSEASAAAVADDGAAAAAAAADTAGADGADDGIHVPTRPVVRVRTLELVVVVLLLSALFLPRLGAYCLWDPWEGHYAEVARRMLADEDWIHLKWQHESFRSKPVLTFWLMGFGMKTFGVGEGGGFSGEFVVSPWTEFALRLPFALFGIAGLALTWYALARLYSRRVAWLATGIVATCPYYFFITRQAITDMPSCAMLMGSIALFALAVFDDQRELRPWARLAERWKLKLTWNHLFIAVFSIIMLGQLVYMTAHLEHNRLLVAPKRAIPGPWTMVPFYLGWAGITVWAWLKTKHVNQVYMYFFYVLCGMATLAKGPVAPGLAGLTILVYLVLSSDWKLLKRCEIPIGILITLAIAIPWHLAMYEKDGRGWYNEYINQHLINRATKGVFGDRGTFNYFISQLGPGMFPWIALVPAALGSAAMMGRARTREEKLRLLVGVWAIVGLTFFCIITTKFHHYILPAVPALGMLVAFYLDDLLEGRVRRPAIGLAVSLALFAVVAWDLVPHQEKLVHLYIFRYDRPWPKGPPWNIDFTSELFWLAILCGAAFAALLVPRVRKWAVAGSALAALAFAVFVMQVLMVAASPHWGQKQLHRVYYQNRVIHGVDLIYPGLRELWRDFGDGKEFAVRSAIPDNMAVGDPMTITIQAGGENLSLRGAVSRVDKGDSRFWIHVDEGSRRQLDPLLERARNSKDPPRQRILSVNADRLLAWQLNWRGENFYSGGEIYQHQFEDARTVFMEVDNKKFLDYLKAPARNGKGRKFWVITEKGRLAGLKNVLPTAYGKQTFQEEDNSCNKFGLGSFVMDQPGTPQAPGLP